MNTIEVCVCDGIDCGRPILTPEMGFIVEGGVYTADPKRPEGILGNGEGRKTAYCRDCFIDLLGLGPKKRHPDFDDGHPWHADREA